jgi:hypothetical protein
MNHPSAVTCSPLQPSRSYQGSHPQCSLAVLQISEISGVGFFEIEALDSDAALNLSPLWLCEKPNIL